MTQQWDDESKQAFEMCTAAEVAELTIMAKEYIAFIKKLILTDNK